MTINRQKFLAELGRLLTFMYEEDRQRALAMYNSIFDEADNEQDVLQLFVSPTRQAVNLARVYDAKERKLQVHTQSRADDALAGEEDELPAFVETIERLRDEAAALGIAAPQADDDQLSLFGGEVDESLFEEEPAPAAPAVEEEIAEDAGPLDGEVPAVREAVSDAAEPVEAAVEDEVPADEVEAFLADFSIEDQELPKSAENAPAVQAEAPAQPEDAPAAETFDELPPLETAPLHDVAAEPEAPAVPEAPAPVPTRRKARGFLLFLFILVAIPMTLLCIGLLLIPTVVSFCLGLSGLYGGVMSFLSGIANFSVFADILLVIGVALIVLALGLLFAWIFIWLLGGAIPGVIRGVCALGRKWCYKEVPVE